MRGVTLIEMLVATVILVILSAAFVQLFVVGNACSKYITTTSDMADDGNAGMFGFPGLNGFLPKTWMAQNVVGVSASTLTLNITATPYQFYLSGNQLILKNLFDGKTSTVADSVQSVAFKYYGMDTSTYTFAEMTDTSLISTVTLDLEIQSSDKKRTLPLSATVTMRNFGG